MKNTLASRSRKDAAFGDFQVNIFLERGDIPELDEWNKVSDDRYETVITIEGINSDVDFSMSIYRYGECWYVEGDGLGGIGYWYQTPEEALASIRVAATRSLIWKTEDVHASFSRIASRKPKSAMKKAWLSPADQELYDNLKEAIKLIERGDTQSAIENIRYVMWYLNNR